MLSNLLENALRHGRADGEPARVRVAARRAGRGIELQVRDHGPGVPAAELERLLRPFARLDDARGERGGSGLGLAIVDRLAQRYAGSCRLSNAPDGGLLATVTLPDAAAAAESAR
jgi:two-component system osmolarity sensor histidine kinase EnvZ